MNHSFNSRRWQSREQPANVLSTPTKRKRCQRGQESEIQVLCVSGGACISSPHTQTQLRVRAANTGAGCQTEYFNRNKLNVVVFKGCYVKPLIIFVFDPKDTKASQKSTLRVVEQFYKLAETIAVSETSRGVRGVYERLSYRLVKERRLNECGLDARPSPPPQHASWNESVRIHAHPVCHADMDQCIWTMMGVSG